jgi:membrane-bound serine protease (ClpP class)
VKRLFLLASTAVLVTAVLAITAVAAGAATTRGLDQSRVLAIHFTEDVNPVTQGWLNSELDRAQNGGYSAAVIVLDTPGGLEDSMRKIVQKELSLKIPVIVYVSPGGARAASAGVWISEAADILAMAPETNIGSSTPIDSSGQNIGSDLRRKAINDAAASLRGLAKSHGRNAKWADSAVRVAANLTQQEALDQHVIDLVAPTLPALLDQIAGRTTVPRHFTLHTKGAEIVTVSPGFFTGFLSTLIDPNIVSLLFLAGIVGLAVELFHPGVVIPGAFGAICMITALFGFSVLPLDWGGLALILLGIALLVIDLHVPTHGALTLSGLVAMAIGVSTLFNGAPSPYRTSVPLVVAVTVCLGGFWAFAMSRALALRRRPAAIGPDDVVGMEAVVDTGGYVIVHGERWRAESDSELSPGQHVQVESRNGLAVRVKAVEL